ncbi:MAG: MBL fold metallo-hydrolase [Sphaerochaetaceae bacterium]
MKRLILTFVNVGYGEAMLLQFDDDAYTMIIDGGSNEKAEYAPATGRVTLNDYLQSKQIKHVNLLVCTHIHEDHVSGLLPVVNRLPPDEFWQTLPVGFSEGKQELPLRGDENLSDGKFIHALNDYLEISEILRKRGKIIKQIGRTNKTIDLPCGGKLKIIAPDKVQSRWLEENLSALWKAEDYAAYRDILNHVNGALNNYSLVLLLEYAGIRILLPGDTNARGLETISDDLSSDIFKIGHHGQNDAMTSGLFKRIKPRFVVCCASSDRRYQSAEPNVLSLMQREGAHLYFSDCPPVLESSLEPHHALVFTIMEGKPVSVAYEMV